MLSSPSLFAVLPGRPSGLAQYLICALFFLMPFNGITAVNRSLLILFIFLSVFRLVKQRWQGAIPWPVLAWFSVPVVSLLWSVDVVQTRSQLVPDVIYPLLGFMAGYGLLSLAERRLALLSFIAGLSVLCGAAVWIVVQYGPGETQPFYDLTHGVGKFSTLIAMALPLLAGWLLSRPQAWQAVAVSLLLAGAVVSENRMIWISLAMAGGLMFMVWWRMAGEGLSRGKKVLLGLLLLAGLVTAYVLIASNKPGNYLVPHETTSLLAAFTRNERFEMWAFWLERWQAAPWLGIGFGYDIQHLFYGALKPAHWPPLVMAHAHNVFLDYAVQLGVFGLSCFVLMLAWLAWQFMRRICQQGLWIEGVVGLALMIGMVSKSLTDDYFTRVPLLMFWLLIGIVLGARRCVPQEGESSR